MQNFSILYETFWVTRMDFATGRQRSPLEVFLVFIFDILIIPCRVLSLNMTWMLANIRFLDLLTLYHILEKKNIKRSWYMYLLKGKNAFF